MFRRIEDTMQADPSFAPDLKELGFFIDDTDHIRMIGAPDKPFVFNATNNERVNEVRREAFHTCVRREVEMRLANLGLSRIHLPQFTADQPDGPSVPILASSFETLKTSKRVIVLVNDTTQDLGILSYSHLQREGGINGGSVINFAKELIKHSCIENTTKQDAEIFQDGSKLEDKSTPPGLIVMNTGQLLYSHKHRQAMTLRSWSAMPRKSICHDMVLIHEENYIQGHRTAKEHIQTVFDQVLFDSNCVSADAEIYVIAIENGAENVLDLLADDFPKYGTRLTALALIHCPVDDSQIKNPQLRTFLHSRTRQWKFNDTTSNPLDCISLPKAYSCSQKFNLVSQIQDTHLDDNDDDDDDNNTSTRSTDWASGRDVVCPTFGGGENPCADYVFTHAVVQKAVLACFEQVAREGRVEGEAQGQGDADADADASEWEPLVEGPKVRFAGTMVESELLKAAGLMDEDHDQGEVR